MDLTTRAYSLREMVGQFLALRPPNTTRNCWNAINRWGGFLHPTEDWTVTTLELWLKADAHQAKLFFQNLRNQGYKYSTLNVYRWALRAFYDEMIGTGFVIPQGNPFMWVKFPRGSTRAHKRTVALTENQAALLLSLPDRNHPIGRRDYALLCLLLGAAARRCEVLGLTYDDIQTHSIHQTAVVVFRRSKGRVFREVEVGPWVLEGLRAFGERAGYLFPYSPSGLHKFFKRYLRQAGLCTKTYSLHSCRKCAITKLLMDGIPHRDVTPFSGHKSVQMVEYYDEGFVSKPGPGVRLIYGGKAYDNQNILSSGDKNLRLKGRTIKLELA